MALLNSIPPELQTIIESCITPVKCGNCEQTRFDILSCIKCPGHHKLCYDCVTKCSICDVTIDNFKPREGLVPLCHYNCRRIANKYDINLVDDTKFYCPGTTCWNCKQNVCHGCAFVGSRKDGVYPCPVVILWCKQCDPILSTDVRMICKREICGCDKFEYFHTKN